MTVSGKRTRSDGKGRRASAVANNKKGAVRGRKPKASVGDEAHALDVHVGSKVRQRRNALGMNQGALGDAVGLTFQQIQKYERGANRIGASRLYEFSRFLDVPISYFFEGVPDTVTNATVERFATGADIVDLGPETLTLVKLYYRITDPTVRHRFYELVKAVSREEA